MKYKAIAIDLDGTLLDTDQNISERTVNSLNSLREKGIHVIAVTGRTLEEIQEYDNCLCHPGDTAVLQGGGVITSFEGGRLIDNYAPFKKEDVQKLIDIGHRNGVCPLVYMGEVPFVEEHDNPYIGEYEKIMRHPVIRVEDVIRAQRFLPVCKIAFLGSREIVNNVVEELEKADLDISYGRSAYWGLDVCRRGKRAALLELLSELNVKREELVAIGDSENDVEMVSLAGLGVAVGNASEKLIKVADLVVADNDHSGVAEAIEQIF